MSISNPSLDPKFLKGIQDNLIKAIPEVELAYAAGIIDGEGYVGVLHSNTGQYQLRVTVEMTDKKALDFLDKIIKGKWYYKPAKSPRRARHLWMLFGEKARKFLLLIRPYMLIKAHIVDEILIADWVSFKGKPLSEDEKTTREGVFQNVKRHNKRGYEGDES